jgi:hypothetical protein
MMLALRTIMPAGSSGEQSQRVGRYELLLRRCGGLRSDVWLAIDADAERFEQVVALEHYVPHEPGPALYHLETELDFARELKHENVARTLEVGFESGRHFIVKEHLEGVTLEALLRCQLVAGERVPSPAVVHILFGVISAVEHADAVSRSVGAKVLSRQRIEIGDVRLTHEGQVKVLGFKMPLVAEAQTRGDTAAATATSLVAFLAEHLSPELRAPLAQASGEAVRPCDRLARVRQILEAEQAASGGAGRRALSTLLAGLPPSLRVEPRVRLEAAFDAAARAGRLRARPLGLIGTDGPAPSSGLRRIEIPETTSGLAPRVPPAPKPPKRSRSQQTVLLICACFVAALTSFLVTH